MYAIYSYSLFFLPSLCAGGTSSESSPPNGVPCCRELFEGDAGHVVFYEGDQRLKRFASTSTEDLSKRATSTTSMQDGNSVTYHLNGNISRIAYYEEEFWKGLRRLLFQWTAQSSIAYLHGMQHGVVETFWPNGNKKEEGKYEMGKKCEPFSPYYEEGSRAAQVPFVNGLPSGTCSRVVCKGGDGDRPA